jgi:hypothetical protein
VYVAGGSVRLGVAQHTVESFAIKWQRGAAATCTWRDEPSMTVVRMAVSLTATLGPARGARSDAVCVRPKPRFARTSITLY